MNFLNDEEIKAKTSDELVAYNQVLMAEKDAITERQLQVKAEINSRIALARFNAMPEAEKKAIAQHISANKP